MEPIPAPVQPQHCQLLQLHWKSPEGMQGHAGRTADIQCDCHAWRAELPICRSLLQVFSLWEITGSDCVISFLSGNIGQHFYVVFSFWKHLCKFSLFGKYCAVFPSMEALYNSPCLQICQVLECPQMSSNILNSVRLKNILWPRKSKDIHVQKYFNFLWVQKEYRFLKHYLIPIWKYSKSQLFNKKMSTVPWWESCV